MTQAKAERVEVFPDAALEALLDSLRAPYLTKRRRGGYPYLTLGEMRLERRSDGIVYWRPLGLLFPNPRRFRWNHGAVGGLSGWIRHGTHGSQALEHWMEGLPRPWQQVRSIGQLDAQLADYLSVGPVVNAILHIELNWDFGGVAR